MRLLGQFWAAARDALPDAAQDAETLRFGAPGELTELFTAGGLADVREECLEVSSIYRDFEELWSTLLLGVGPAAGPVTSGDQFGQQLAGRQL